MIWTLTPNPALDLTYRLDHLEVGGVHRVTDVSARPGGKGLNVSRVLAALGVPSCATGFLGGANGLLMAELLGGVPGAELITDKFVRTDAETRRSVAITAEGDATVLNEAGAPQSKAAWDEVVGVVEHMNPGDVVAICGSLPPDTDPARCGEIVRAAHARGCVVVADTSGEALAEAARAGADVLKPNHLELAALTGEDDIAAGIAVLHGYGARLVVCSRGEEGVTAGVAGGSLVTQPALERIEGNPTGAGDSTVAALVRAIDRDGLATADDESQLAAWLHDAQALAAATVAAPVAGEFDPDLYERLRSTRKD